MVGYSYSYGGGNNFYYALQGKKTTDNTNSGWTYSGSGTLCVGCNQPMENNCQHSITTNMGFYELLVFEYSLSIFTQKSIFRNFRSVRLNQKARIKKWPVAAFSVRKVNTTYYNGPTMKISRADGALANLYCNEYGVPMAIYEISTSTNKTTVSAMQTWIGG